MTHCSPPVRSFCGRLLLCCLLFLWCDVAFAADLTPEEGVSSPPPTLAQDEAISTNTDGTHPQEMAGAVTDAQKPEPPGERSPSPDGQTSAPKTSQPSIKLFGTIEFKSRKPIEGWVRVLKKIQADNIFIDNKKLRNSTTWQQFKAGAHGKQGLDLLRYVHSFWNKSRYVEDIRNWGVQDYWETPAEFVEKSGDCEDYAITKYFTLKALNFPYEMRIAVGKDTIGKFDHAVLIVYLDNEAYLLDNLRNDVVPCSRVRNFQLGFTINELAHWRHMPASAARK